MAKKSLRRAFGEATEGGGMTENRSTPVVLSRPTGLARVTALPPGFRLIARGHRGLVLWEGRRELAVVRAPENKRLRVLVCLVHAARLLHERNDLRRREMAALRKGDRVLACRLSDQWIEAQRQYDRAVNLAYGRLGARVTRRRR